MPTKDKRDFVLRFAIADQRGALSSVWRIWKGRGKDDIYIVPRPIVSLAKGSLHASGHCFFSFTSQHQAQLVASGGAREKRAFTRWQRHPTPSAGLVNVVSSLFAAEYLSLGGSPVEANTALIEAPEPGQAVIIDLLYGRGGRVSLRPNQHQIGHVALSTGEDFFVISGLVDDFDAQTFRQHHQPFADDTQIGFLHEPPGADFDDLRGTIILPALGDGVLRIVEIGPAYVLPG
jgi:hypothetical protein